MTGNWIPTGTDSLSRRTDVTRLLRYVMVVGGAVISILLFLLASASENSNLFERNYPWLLILNAAVAAALLALVGLLLFRLYKRYRAGKFGSRLMTRLVMLFALIGILPGILIYTVSVQFVSRSIESWFDVRVESALEAGLNLGRSALDSSLRELQIKARNMALELAEMSDATQITQLSRMRDQNLQQDALIVTGTGQMIASSGSQLASLLPDFPSPEMIRQVKLTRSYGAIERTPEFQDGSSASSSNTNTIIAPVSNSPGLRFRVLVEIPTSTRALSLQT